MKPEDLLVERVLVSYVSFYQRGASSCVRSLVVTALNNNLAIDWQEVLRLASLPEYKIETKCVSMVREVANELGVLPPV
jgi:hypothetical protein